MSTQISQYYSGKFPFSALEKLLTARGDDISQREFGLDGAFFQRYVCSADRGGLKQSLTLGLLLQEIGTGKVGEGASAFKVRNKVRRFTR